MWSDQQPVTAVNKTQTSLPRITGWFGLRCAVVLVPLSLVTGCQGGSSTAPPSGVVELTDANFHHEVMESKQPVLVEFWAPWCKPCLEMQPAVEQLAQEFSGRVKVCSLNIDESREIPSTFNVQSLPAVIVFRDGKLIRRRTGKQTEDELQDLIHGL